MESWTLPELVAEATRRIAALPPPKNGQVRAVPDERTIRYYGTIGLLDRPAAMRGRTALYSERHLAQVVAIKRLQGAGRSLAEIQGMWPIEDEALQRISGIKIEAKPRASREGFWKKAVESTGPSRSTSPSPSRSTTTTTSTSESVELRIELAHGVTLMLGEPIKIPSAADVAALRSTIVAELARRGLVEEKKP